MAIVAIAGTTIALARPALASDDAGSGSLTVALAALLGALQGATEFLPVSSSGHLALAQRLFGIDAEAAGHRFNVVVHAGTLLAVVWIYRADIWLLLRAAAAPHRASPSRDWLVAIAIATLPLGLALVPGVKPAVIAMEGNARLVGVALWVTAIVLWIAFRNPAPLPDAPDVRAPAWRAAIGVGLAQLCAVLPGVSRSGSTIAAGLLLGIDRERAARFSFLISIPAIAGASVLELRDALSADAGAIDPLPYAVGFLAALVVGFVCLRWLLVLVRGGRIGAFVVYLAIVGGIAIAIG